MKKYIILICALLIAPLIVKGVDLTIDELQSLLNDQQLGATVLQVYQGGTGAQTFTTGECLVGAGTGAITTQACGGSGGGTWEELWTDTITPTNTSAGLFVKGSTTIDEQLKIGGDLHASSTVLIDSNATTTSSMDAAGYCISGTNCIDAWPSDTTLTEEAVEDYVGGMLTGNTETLIGVDYQDGDGTIDFVVDNDLHKYSWANVVDSDITNTLTCSDLQAGSSVVSDAEVDDNITVTDYMQDEDINTISELNTWVTDATLLVSGGTLNDTQVCVADGTGGAIDCNITQTYWVQDGCTDCLNATEIEDIYVLLAGDVMTGGLELNSVTTTDSVVIGGYLTIADNATTTASMDALEYCINGASCISTWPSSGTGIGPAWNEYTDNVLTPTNTAAGIFVLASSSIVGDFTVIDNFNLPSTTATSTIATPIVINGSQGNNAIRINANKTYNPSTSVGGAFLINNTANPGAGMVIYSNEDSAASGRLLVLRADNVAFDQQALFIQHDGTSGAFFSDCNLASGNAVECASVDSEKQDMSAMGISGQETGKGTLKITHEYPSAADGNASALSIDVSGAGTAAKGIFVDSSGATTGELLNVRNDGNEKFVISHTGYASSTAFIAVDPSGGGVVSYLDYTGDLYVEDDVEIDGILNVVYASTTEYISIGNDDGTDDDILYFDAKEESLTWDDSPGEFDLSDDLNIVGTASSTAGFRVNDDFVVDSVGRATTTHTFDITDGTHGVRIIPGATTTFEFY